MMTYPIRVRASALIVQNDSILLVEFQNENGLPLNELSQVVLYPNIREEIVAYVQQKRTIKFIEEQQLKEYM
ncbi:hypothetical protein [Lysinibacillus sp. LZ02]|uniref:hypothetical protein n=1 Tax=Lysinibacillus sp. LZ02 TaxID=3420668 RepID=UPI003D36B61C